MKKNVNLGISNTEAKKVLHSIKNEKITEKAIFGELYQVRKINNLVHKLTFSIQRNKELIADNYPQFEWEMNYLQKELEKINELKNKLIE